MYAEFSRTLDLDVNQSLQALAAALRERKVPWMRDLVPALCGLAIHVDPDHPDLPDDLPSACRALLEEAFKSAGRFEDAGRVVDVPVCYDEAVGPDLKELAQKLGLPAADIVARHVKSPHRVLMVGFAPGQPYIGGLDPKLMVPRRATPRTKLPAGSVAIAIGQTTVYPYETPGGWHIVGRTPVTVFDPARENASLFAPGDRVRFHAVGREEYLRLGGREP